MKVEIEETTLLLLDGKCEPGLQQVIDGIKMAMSIKTDNISQQEAAMIVEIIEYAKKSGKLNYWKKDISRCPCCSRSDGYDLIKRNSKYKYKGQTDYSSPKLFQGFELKDSFMSIKDNIFLGFCASCKDRVLPVLLKNLEGIRVEIPKGLSGRDPAYKKIDIMKCKKCGWEGSEIKVGLLPTLFGDGYFRGKCPACKAESSFCNAVMIGTGKFEVIDAEAKVS